MRRRIPYRVCRCTPKGVVTHLEARLLRELVNREIHAIRCAASCKRKFQKAMYIGDLCAETGHYFWALKVWRLAARLIENKDYDDWRDVHFDNCRVRLREVISEAECELLQQRCRDVWQALGRPENARWDAWREYLCATYSGTTYYYLFAEKYDGYFEEPLGQWERDMIGKRDAQETRQTFREGQGENLPTCSQDFFDYWQDGPQSVDFSWLSCRKEWLPQAESSDGPSAGKGSY